MVKRIEFDLDAGSEIRIHKVGGALHLKAWDLPQIRVDFQHDKDVYDQKKNKISISAESDCILRVPSDVSVIVEKVGADAYLTGFDGKLVVEKVGGSLTLKRLHEVAIESVAGNLSARDISGSLTIENISGNITLKNVEGAISAENVTGNFDLKNGGETLAVLAMGNASIQTELMDGAAYTIECKGNAYCKLIKANNLSASLESHAHRILVQTLMDNLSLDEQNYALKLGDGSASLTIEAGGHIDFQAKSSKDYSFDFDVDLDENFDFMVGELGDQISYQLESQLEALESQLESLSTHLQSSGEDSIRKAQRKVEDATRRLEQRMRARSGSRGPRKSVIGLAGKHFTGEPVSDEERMKVLEMVQEKKIGVQEAEVLLAALEGRKIERTEKPEAKPTEAKDEK